MHLLSAEQLAKSYGMKRLFGQLNFYMEDGDRIGLIGINGTGKTTLLQILAGTETPDEGQIAYANGIRIAYLPQNPDYDPELTVLQQLFQGQAQLLQLLQDYEQKLAQVTSEPENEKLQQQLTELHTRLEAENAWQLETEAKKMLFKLGIELLAMKMGELSGGQRKRVLLAGVLIQPADLLILDEPTNHLDTDAIDWIEQYLNRTKTALLMITHDRYFLDRVVNRIIELDQGTLYGYEGNYSLFLEKKAERLEQSQASERKKANLFRSELAWIRRGARARSTKQKARIERFEQLKRDKPAALADELDISLAGSRLGKKGIELNYIGKTFEGRTIIRNFSYIVQRGDRIGVIGPNGSGKSTLLNMIAGLIQPDAGTVEIGSTVKIGYFSQEASEMDASQRVIDYVKEGAEQIKTADGSTISAAQMLERFLFPGELQWSPVGKLSGGEKRRLFLLRILMEGPNVLLLDEPTNDLDIQSLTVLESYLDDFAGAVIAVSHDRYFLDRVADSILAFEGQGSIRHHVGNYADYQEYRKQHGDPTEEEEKRGKTEKTQDPDADRKNRGLRFSYKEQQEFAQIDERIAEAEAQLEKINEAINSAGSDFEKLQALTSERQELEQKLEALMDRWTYLNELAEEIERQKIERQH